MKLANCIEVRLQNLLHTFVLVFNKKLLFSQLLSYHGWYVVCQIIAVIILMSVEAKHLLIETSKMASSICTNVISRKAGSCRETIFHDLYFNIYYSIILTFCPYLIVFMFHKYSKYTYWKSTI